jgi:hypothetical protein
MSQSLHIMALSRADEIQSNFQTKRHALDQCVDDGQNGMLMLQVAVAADWHKLNITSSGSWIIVPHRKCRPKRASVLVRIAREKSSLR